MADPLTSLIAEWEFIDEVDGIVCMRIIVRDEDEILSDVIALFEPTCWTRNSC
jgi:hypothetical protein